ncbi:centromere protein F-like isoform X3 [Mauremys reevesii]|uniref:centromere protein F-like isoform X2 n=1 Tax=Mauremys reevesii TaxID=260615 RepID=UPI00193FC0C2|nr:centromere protein F-like isoform X2 [Mauremys reevesii]XP_039386868.1 centromere protein F-like isoform X3 [Mauremys reevesii]
MEYMKSLGSSVIEIIKAKNKREMLEQKMDDLLSHQRQFVENNRRSLEQKIKEKEKEVFHQLHDLLRGDLPCDQINQDLQQANDALQAELDKEMEEKNLLRCQCDQKSEEIHQLQEELKTAKQFLKETQNYAEEMKKKSLSQEIQLEKKEAEIRDLEGKNQDLTEELEKVQSELQLKQAEIAHLQNLSAAELACLKKEIVNIKAEQKKLQEQLNNSLQENEQLSKLDNLKVQQKKQNGFAHSKLKTWMQSCADEMAHSLTQDNEQEYEPDGLPEVVRKGFADIPTGKTNPCVLRRTALNLKTSPRLAAQSQNLSPYGQCLQKGRSANFAKISKPTAGGSKSPKVDDTQQRQAETAIEPMESRSPLCMKKQHTQAVAENSRENLHTHQGRCSLSTQKLPDQNEQDKNCMVQ